MMLSKKAIIIFILLWVCVCSVSANPTSNASSSANSIATSASNPNSDSVSSITSSHTSDLKSNPNSNSKANLSTDAISAPKSDSNPNFPENSDKNSNPTSNPITNSTSNQTSKESSGSRNDFLENSPLERLEKYYSDSEYDKAISFARKCLEKLPKEHPSRQRAYDIMILSIEANSRQKLIKEKNNDLKEAKREAEADAVEGTTYLTNKMYSEAKARFQRSINKFPKEAETYYLLGYCEKNLGNNADAYLAFKECVKRNPSHPRALFHLSEMSYKQKNFSEAEDFSNRLSRIIAERLAELKKDLYEQKAANLNDKAMATVRKMAALKKNLAQAQYLIGILASRRGDSKESYRALTLAAKLDPEPMETDYHLGRVNIRLKQFSQAAQAFEKAILLGENTYREKKANAKKLLDGGKSDEAVAEEAKAKEIGRRLAMCWLGLSITSVKISDISAAFDAVDKALEYQPDLRQARYAKAMLFSETRDFPSAQREIRQLLKTAPPNSEEARMAIACLKNFLRRSLDLSSGKKGILLGSMGKHERPAIIVDRFVKDSPGIGGRKTEAEWEEILPAMLEIKDLISLGNVPEAVVKLKGLRGRHPNLVQIHGILGRLYTEQGRFTDALGAFDDALRLNPHDAECLANWAYISTLKGQKLDKALDRAQEAVELCPERAEFRHTLGWIWFQKGELDNAIEHLQKALKIKPDYTLARYNLGLAYYLAGNFPTALECFETVITSRPDHVKAVLFRGITLAKMKKNKEAIEVLEALKSKLPQKEVMFSVVSELQTKFKLALERNTEIPIPEIRHPAPIQELLEKARIYRSKYLVNRAKELYLKCQRLNPKAFEPYYELGEMYAEEGLYTPAARTWETALKINPNSYPLQFNLGKMAHKLGRRDEARKAFTSAQALNSNDPEPPYYLGLIAYEDGRYESAESYSLAALRLKGRFLKALSLLGMARMRLERYMQARDAFESVYSISPPNSSIRRLAGKKLWELSKLISPLKAPSFDDAMTQRKALEKRAEKDPNGEKLRREIIEGRKAEPIVWSRLSPDEKVQIRKNLDSFPQALPDASLKNQPGGTEYISSQLSIEDKAILLNRIKDFRTANKVYPPPPAKMSSKYAIHEVSEAARKPDPSDETNKKGLEAAEKGFLNDALGEFEKAYKISPKNLDVLLNLGYLHSVMGNFKDSFDYFAQAATYHQKHPFGKLGLGNLYWLGGRGAEAVEQWRKMGPAVKVDPEFQLFGKSESAWKRVLDSNPKDSEAHSHLGLIYLFTGRMQNALAEFNAVLSLSPNRREHVFYQIQTYVILYVTSHVTSYKTQAKVKMVELESSSPNFPHLQEIKAYLDTL
ncbi:MAG: tetratricopeptide repeat protein [Candidatus Riflebacteria bacterium]|nr:tetratricopeptide repeat protein [Candidatus Riflebacteria bacterium]